VWNHLSELFHIQKQFDLDEVKHVKIFEQLAYGICSSCLLHLIMTPS
jgi:hypothetical protein